VWVEFYALAAFGESTGVGTIPLGHCRAWDSLIHLLLKAVRFWSVAANVCGFQRSQQIMVSMRGFERGV
jgi:hypothetical protein